MKRTINVHQHGVSNFNLKTIFYFYIIGTKPCTSIFVILPIFSQLLFIQNQNFIVKMTSRNGLK